MENHFISFIYPNEELRSYYSDPSHRPNITNEVCEQLGLNYLLNLKSGSLCDFFVDDEKTIEYRQKTIQDLKNNEGLSDVLSRLVPVLCDISELRQLNQESHTSGDLYLYSITEIELYVSAIENLYEGLKSYEGKFESPAFINLWNFISEFTCSAYFKDLNERLKDLTRHVHEIKSITVGVNLDSQFRPVDAGIVSINADTFKGGKVLDKILRMSFKNDSMTCIAPLVSMTRNQQTTQEALSSSVFEAMEDIFHSSIRSWKTIVELYVLENTDFLLKLLPEIEFVTKAYALEVKLKEKNYTLCTPTIAPKESKTLLCTRIYNPSVALQIEDEIVYNDFDFDDQAKIYVLTGPNRGGKSVITCAVGIAQCLFQLGLGIPADTCTISLVDGIFTHFPQGAEDTIDKGRLGEECARLREIFENITEDSMVLLDESLSSTGAYEASYIAGELLTGLSCARCRAIFSTHLHELSSTLPSIMQETQKLGGVPIDTLVAGIEEGKRSFLITRKKPDGKSYAKDIAEKYGLSFEGIQQILKQK